MAHLDLQLVEQAERESKETSSRVSISIEDTLIPLHRHRLCYSLVTLHRLTSMRIMDLRWYLSPTHLTNVHLETDWQACRERGLLDTASITPRLTQ